ncbi:MAG: sugar transferase, partial [Pseudomonadota bacterium]|nr:sugar transferase [Pseudomonadota bacterium]
ALLILSPVFLVTALYIRLDSKGPIFFGQQRVGKHGKCFKMWKFRSMYFNAEEQKAALKKFHNLEREVRFKLRYDPRITPVGKIIRKYSLDELPQLWNVLRGEMSLVGPRPPLICEVLHYNLYQLQRLDIKPGITCIWQVSGRSELPFQRQVELDLEYIATQSFLGDLMLILKTIPAVLKGQGAW